MPEEVSVARDNDSEEAVEIEGEAALSDGFIIDYITGEKHLRDTPKEQVRQFIAHALEKQYNIDLEDMQADFVVGSGKNRKVIDIAIFHRLKDHSDLNLSRAVICRPM